MRDRLARSILSIALTIRDLRVVRARRRRVLVGGVAGVLLCVMAACVAGDMRVMRIAPGRVMLPVIEIYPIQRCDWILPPTPALRAYTVVRRALPVRAVKVNPVSPPTLIMTNPTIPMDA